MAQTEPSDKLVKEFLDMGFSMDEREAKARLKVPPNTFLYNTNTFKLMCSIGQQS